MGLFADKEPIPISVDGGVNTIYVKPRLGMGERNVVQDEGFEYNLGDGEGNPGARIFHAGRYQTALLQASVVNWTGPLFTGKPCTPENIAKLDDGDPDEGELVAEVIRQVTERNQPRQVRRDPKLPPPTTNGASPNGTAAYEVIDAPVQVVSGKRTSS